MFSPRHIVFWLAVALQGVNALNAANPYEMVYMYYAYKMEWASGVAAADRKIAPGCTHKAYTGIPTAPLALIENANLAAMATQGVSGICTFFDFWKYAGTHTWLQMWTGQEIAKPNPTQPPLTRTIDPDADRIADVMNNPAKIGPKKLLSLPGKMWSAAAIAEMGGGIPAADIPWAQVCTKAAFALCLNKESRFSGAFLGVAKKKDEFKISGSSAPRLLVSLFVLQNTC
jgi:hypothetical protein